MTDPKMKEMLDKKLKVRRVPQRVQTRNKARSIYNGDNFIDPKSLQSVAEAQNWVFNSCGPIKGSAMESKPYEISGPEDSSA